jgi:preprotein translocase subunit SecE
MNREMRRMMEREERLQKKQRAEAPSRQQQVAASATRRQRGERGPLVQRVRRYFHDVRVELKKVSWPTSEQMKNFTTVTLITSIALTLVVFGLDFGMKELVLIVLGGING